MVNNTANEAHNTKLAMTKLVSKRPEWNNFLLYNVIIHNAQDKCLFQLKVNHTMAHMGESFSIGDLIYELITELSAPIRTLEMQ